MNSLSDLITPTYAIPVLIGLLLLLFFPAGKNIKAPEDRNKYRILQVCTLLGAVIGAKISVLMGDLRWPLEPLVEPQAAPSPAADRQPQPVALHTARSGSSSCRSSSACQLRRVETAVVPTHAHLEGNWHFNSGNHRVNQA